MIFDSSDRRRWPIHRRAYAVLREEGIAGMLRRLAEHWMALYRRFVPSDPSDAYDTSFFEMSRKENSYCSALANWLVQSFRPDATLDVGCGDCSLLVALSQHSVSGYGMDGSSAAVLAAPLGILVIQVDLNRPFLLNKKFPLVCCIEVAEHLPKRSAKSLVASLVKHAQSTILFSAAHTSQGGLGHINEQPREYWLNLFACHNWIEHALQTHEAKWVLQSAGAPKYLLQNVIVLHQGKTSD